MNALELRRLIEEKGKIEACDRVSTVQIVTEPAADAFLFAYVSRLLNADRYAAAGLVLWGEHLFNPKPNCVRRVWHAILNYSKVLLQGASGTSKSYAAMALLLLEWLRDPEFTNIKLLSTTAGHAKANTYSTMARMVRLSIVPFPGREPLSDYIGLDPKERQSGISVIAIPEGKSGETQLQGFHPTPRPKPHPVLGPSSRVIAFIDEAEGTPNGIWSGVDNMLGSITGKTVRVVAAYNPHNIASHISGLAEPAEGWNAVDPETGLNGSDEWMSKRDWHVVRLDAAKLENVKRRENIYPGLQTYEGYQNLACEPNSPSYWTFGRALYPPLSAMRLIIQNAFLQRQKGDFVFVGKTTKVTGTDVAVDGRDRVVMTVGRYGMATAFQHKDGELTQFNTPRWCAQVDQQFELAKGETKIVGDEIKKNAIAVGAAPEWSAMDSTGNGAAVWSYLRAIWSDDVFGVDFGGRATDIKILDEDKNTPYESLDGVNTEMLFAIAEWLEFGFLAISPLVDSDKLDRELIGRIYFNSGKKLVNGKSKELRKAEKKDDYIARMLGKSPDYCDSLCVWLHVIRMRAHLIAAMLEQRTGPSRPVHGPTDTPSFLYETGI